MSNTPKSITHRDQIHGDVEYDPLSVALLDLAELQRLGRVYQLGYSHLVFRGGTHTRLSHVMGAAHVSGKIVDKLQYNYEQRKPGIPKNAVLPDAFLPSIEGGLPARWDLLRHLVRWAALLHDIGHVPLGHTLEDEFEGILEKHDDLASARTTYIWLEDGNVHKCLTDKNLYPRSIRGKISPTTIWQTVLLICFYKDVRAKSNEHANFREWIVKQREKGEQNTDAASEGDLRRRNVAQILLKALDQTTNVFRPYMADIVGNTICADYLDYLRRDPTNVGLDVLRDDRVLSHFYVTKPQASSEYRMALALVDRRGKPRLDVCTGVVELVRQRYRFAELIYYHKTKVAASAMFAKAMSLVGTPAETPKKRDVVFDDPTATAKRILNGSLNFEKLRDSLMPSTLTDPEVGDDSLHLLLQANALSTIDQALKGLKKASPASRVERETKVGMSLRAIMLLQSIARRKLHKVFLSINADHFGILTRGANEGNAAEERLAATVHRLRTDRELVSVLEREMRTAAGWPEDSILIYVPPRKSQAKGIETFAFDQDGVVRLGEHRSVSQKMSELSRDYTALWRLLVLVDPRYRNRTIELSKAVDALVQRMWSCFSTADDEEFDLHDSYLVGTIRVASWFPYVCLEHRDAALRVEELAEPELDVYDEIQSTEIDWNRFERAPIKTTIHESITASDEYAERAFLLERTMLHFRAVQPAEIDVEQKAVDEIKRRFPTPGSLLGYVPAQSELRLFQGPVEKQQRWLRAHQLNGMARELVQHLRGLF